MLARGARVEILRSADRHVLSWVEVIPVRDPSSVARSCRVSAYWPQDQEFAFPRRAAEGEMNTLGRLLHTLRVWTGLADASESHLTPSHGWLLPPPAAARQQQQDPVARRVAHTEGNTQA